MLSLGGFCTATLTLAVPTIESKGRYGKRSATVHKTAVHLRISATATKPPKPTEQQPPHQT